MEWFDFAPGLAGHISRAALVISHAVSRVQTAAETFAWRAVWDPDYCMRQHQACKRSSWQRGHSCWTRLRSCSRSVPWQPLLARNCEVLIGVPLPCQGAGSLFEALNAGKTVVAVPNALLMHNHQVSCCCCCCVLLHSSAVA